MFHIYCLVFYVSCLQDELIPAWAKCIRSGQEDYFKKFADNISDALSEFVDALKKYRNHASEELIDPARTELAASFVALLAGEACGSGADSFEKLKLWVSSLPEEDGRAQSTIQTIKYGEALLTAGRTTGVLGTAVQLYNGTRMNSIE